ncbi:MAG: peptidoglycan editing factor PgeF [Oscillospiraceae bacterium]|nr:peptidoglycan editing factor PgeF [Oscillospiraceae bacterium]
MFISHEAPEYLSSDVISGGVVHCFSTRRGGVSTGCLSSLNLGIHRGDDWERVYENYRRLGAAVGFTPEQTVFTRQTHTDVVARVGAADRGFGLFREVEPERDGIYTDEPGVALVCFAADCTPILLFDPVRRAVAAVHAGWRGTALGIAARCVEAMHRDFGSVPSDLRAAIGPCIGPCCFETDRNVPDALLAALGPEAEAWIYRAPHGGNRPSTGEKFYPDLKALNALWLRRAGVRSVDCSTDCTHCQPERFWSHRMTGQARGSQAAVIMLTE